MANNTKPTPEEIMEMLTISLASKPLPQDKLGEIAQALSESYFPVVGIDICTVGIKINRRWEGSVKDIDLSTFVDDRFGAIRSIEIFPEGILVPNGANIRSTHAL
ncbi:hypothetical protein [Sulfitobacter geojensis]|uniref:Uncharacterized protein n=1 Tax=Sulfitobacter geojensis TaxID=1342299 RepID=A0AAE3B8E2_9RHOB|nr:hypothetical protein [Sulfitobacter geojensis]MBM1691609.1 hypothetical protein [Sulfitobacter geojensis]MBM1695675.1 hypothetical protein [Sulfitobacter geojensis]MBM1707840.1 hypothetical protein [Sulfitobacter geojensis]MBM1711899.1 hypothetical protein [Sulfitobacter geojensis]MBM1715964.1 hypothetical protein [Sulfitobacter geojensis]